MPGDGRKRAENLASRPVVPELRPAGHFEAIVESAPNAMVLVDARGRIVLVNAQAETLFDYPRAQLLGQPVELLLPERFRANHVADRAAFAAAPSSRSMGAGRDLFGRRRDGTEVPVEIGLNPIATPEGDFVLAAIVDITERKRAEERFRAAVESAPSAMLMVDADGKVVLVNALAEQMFGHPRAWLLEQNVDVLVPERLRAGHGGYRRAFLADPRSRPMGAGRELFGLRRDGSEFPVEIGLNPIETREGTFVLAAVVDTTERRRAQEALQRRSEEVEAFVYIVSHDLRAPLVNLQGFSRELVISHRELSQVLAGTPLPPEVGARVRQIIEEDVADALRYISASTGKFERLINALLELSRTGRQTYHPEPLDMLALVSGTLDSLRGTIEMHRAEVTVLALPAAWGDRTAVGQVFSNLLANALAYLDPLRRGRIEVGGTPEGGLNHYWVQDNGLGVPPSAWPRLFQVFQRFHPERAEGEGMGLAIIKRVVERHGGRVWAVPVEAGGTAFHLTLPARESRKE